MATLENDSETIEQGSVAWRQTVNDHITRFDAYLKFPISNQLFPPLVACAAGAAKTGWANGTQKVLVRDVRAIVAVAGTTGSMVIDINYNGVTILSTPLTIASGAQDDDGAAVISGTGLVAADGLFSFDVDSIHTTPATGLWVVMDVQIRPTTATS